MQRVAGAKAIPDARRADGAPEQARTSPRPQAGEGSRRCPTRHAADGVQPNSRDKFRVPAQRGVRGCRGCRGGTPLTPCPAPGRRPTARAGQQPQAKEEEGRQKEKLFAGQQPQCTEGHPLNTPGHFNFEKGETRGGAQRRLSPCCRIPGRQQACPRPQPRLESAM